MKKLEKISFLILLLLVVLAGTVCASSEKYLVTKEYVYESTKTLPLTSGFVEILVGKSNFVQYQNDESIIITPTPDEFREDEYGNLYAYFNVEGLRPGQKFKVTIKRDALASTYEEAIPTRTNTVINEETKRFLEPAERIDSDDPSIITKAKEITQEQTTDYKKAQAIFEYVNVKMAYDESATYANKGSLSAFKNMRGVCEEFTTLFIAMCRAVNVPARAIEGYRIEDKISGDTVIGKELINHVWPEIYLEEYGWVPVEPTVIYLVNGQRKAYLDSFCRLKAPDHIAVGIYNYEQANRRMMNVKELEFNETVLISENIIPETQNRFADLANYSWAQADIQSLFAKNIVTGYSETEYGPARNISRIEFITMLARLLKYYDTLGTTGGSVYYYPDYNENHWSKPEYDYLLRCLDLVTPSDVSSIGFDAITDVFGVGVLEMDKPITRAEVVALMDTFLANVSEDTSFTDVSWSTKFRSSIMKAYANGLINGYPDGSFKPNNPITRAEMAAVLNRYIKGKTYEF
ncbi:MAG: S-layer homology domain-containing protein [Clostridia bacterium]|nr:S-layer homology domain-containing protein [Clostridia bacterium]